MKKLSLILLVVFAWFFWPAPVNAEQINAFDARYVINTDGTVSVHENIHYDFAATPRHGIFRTIPLVKQNTEGKKFLLQLSDIFVTDETQKPYTYTKTTDGSNLTLKIGDPDHTTTGAHTYVIVYRVRGALTYFSDHDELNWNVTGTDWQVPIEQTRVFISLPQQTSANDLRLSCFTGSFGSTVSNCQTSYRDGGAIVTAGPLPSGQGVTVVIGFPKGIVATLEPKPYATFFETFLGKIVLVFLFLVAILWYVIAPGVVIYRWWKYGRDPKPAMGVVTAWFDAPKTKGHRRLRPAEAGTLIDERADMADITATIVDLARRGYIKIIETKKDDFTLEKQSAPPDGEAIVSFEQKLLDGIFSSNDRERIKDAKLYETIPDVQQSIYEQVVSDGFFLKSPQSTRMGYAVLGVFSLATGNILLALIAWTFGMAMPRKTLFGAEQAAVAKSLKNFLSSQEKKLAFQARNQMFFEKFLPYAVAFGVEKIWAQRFKNIQMTSPDWYQGYSSGSFTSMMLVNSLSSSVRSISASATPTRSSTGFSSGFSGGSSGGGGGGGGGGSW